MSAVIKLILFILTAGVMPVLTGLLPVSFLPAGSRRIPWIILSGYLTTFAVFELIGLPVLLFTTYGDFMLLTGIFTIADLVLIAAGIFRCRRSGGIRLPERCRRRGFDPDEGLFWILFAALLFFELYMAFTRASYDGDDAYYVAQSVQTWQTGTMYYYVPYTGWTTSIDGRHAMAMMPIWIAYVSTLAGTHPTIITHSMMPVVLIPLVDVCYYCAAAELTAGWPLQRQRRMLPAMLIILAMLQIFGNVSIYTPETFLIMRTWQGKNLLANLILPGAIALLLRWLRVNRGREALRKGAPRRTGAAAALSGAGVGAVSADGNAADAPEKKVVSSVPEKKTTNGRSDRALLRENTFFWIMIVTLGLAAGFCTSLAPAIVTVLLLGAAFLISVLCRRSHFLPAMFLACIPCYLYLVLLLRMMNSQWFSFIQGGRLP